MKQELTQLTKFVERNNNYNQLRFIDIEAKLKEREKEIRQLSERIVKTLAALEKTNEVMKRLGIEIKNNKLAIEDLKGFEKKETAKAPSLVELIKNLFRKK